MIMPWFEFDSWIEIRMDIGILIFGSEVFFKLCLAQLRRGFKLIIRTNLSTGQEIDLDLIANQRATFKHQFENQLKTDTNKMDDFLKLEVG